MIRALDVFSNGFKVQHVNPAVIFYGYHKIPVGKKWTNIHILYGHFLYGYLGGGLRWL